MRIDEATAETPLQVWRGVESRIHAAKYLEEGAQALASGFFDTFNESIVLARVFATVPFGELPATNRAFVAELAGSAELKPTTPVLSLIGTRGLEPDWNDRRRSKGHVGIPIVSSSFVDAIPMISRLLKDVGVPIEWFDTHDTDVVTHKLGQSMGLFFVEDASEAVDERDRKIIAAQDFVARYGVKSVFGTCGFYDNGQLAVLVVFCREAFSRESVELLAVIGTFLGATTHLAVAGSVFADL
jgi:hypothetical protein